MKNRILLIAYSYPPLSDPQSLRWFYLSTILAEMGYSIDVLTIKLPDGFMGSNIFYTHPNIRIFRVFPGFFENVAYKMKTKIGTDKVGNLSKRRKRKFKLLKTGYWIARKTLNNILVGDLCTEWLPFVLKYIKDINLERYSVLITSQEPFVDSLIGLKIKQIMPNAVWIADMGDSVLSDYYPVWRRGVDTYFEKKVVEIADKVILTNNQILNLISEKYSIDRNKFSIVTQGFCKRTVENNFNLKNRNEIFTMLFTGTLYEKFREPYPLIDALEKIDFDFKLIIAGRNESFEKYFDRIKNRVEFVGFVTHFDSLQLQRNADILINISNRQNYQVPGKIFEYLGSRKPILDIVYSFNDETVKLIKDLNAGVVCGNVSEDINKAVSHLYRLWQLNKIGEYFSFDLEKLDGYSWESGAKTLSNVIEHFTRV